MAEKLISKDDFYLLVGDDFPFRFDRRADGKVAVSERFFTPSGNEVTPDTDLLEAYTEVEQPDTFVYPFPFERFDSISEVHKQLLIGIGVRTFEQLLETDNATLAGILQEDEQWVEDWKSRLTSQ